MKTSELSIRPFVQTMRCFSSVCFGFGVYTIHGGITKPQSWKKSGV